MNATRAAIAVETIDSCQIRWGGIVTVDGTQLVMSRRLLHLAHGKLALADEEFVCVIRQIEGHGFADHAFPASTNRFTGTGCASDLTIHPFGGACTRCSATSNYQTLS